MRAATPTRRLMLPVVAISAGFFVAFGPEIVGPLRAVARADTAPNTVAIDNFSFVPKQLIVAPGTEVVWINHDEEPHTVTSGADPKVFKSLPLDKDDKFSFVFKEPGTYPYYCSVHPHMQGTIIVK